MSTQAKQPLTPKHLLIRYISALKCLLWRWSRACAKEAKPSREDLLASGLEFQDSGARGKNPCICQFCQQPALLSRRSTGQLGLLSGFWIWGKGTMNDVTAMPRPDGIYGYRLLAVAESKSCDGFVLTSCSAELLGICPSCSVYNFCASQASFPHDSILSCVAAEMPQSKFHAPAKRCHLH